MRNALTCSTRLVMKVLKKFLLLGCIQCILYCSSHITFCYLHCSKKDVEILTKVIHAIVLLLTDANVMVVKKVMLCLTQLYRLMLQVRPQATRLTFIILYSIAGFSKQHS